MCDVQGPLLAAGRLPLGRMAQRTAQRFLCSPFHRKLRGDAIRLILRFRLNGSVGLFACGCPEGQRERWGRGNLCPIWLWAGISTQQLAAPGRLLRACAEMGGLKIPRGVANA